MKFDYLFFEDQEVAEMFHQYFNKMESEEAIAKVVVYPKATEQKKTKED